MVKLCNLGGFNTPKTVYGQGYAYAINRNGIYWIISDAAGTADPSKYLMYTPVDRTNGLKFNDAIEVKDITNNIGLNFDLVFQRNGLVYRYSGYGTTGDPCGGTYGLVVSSPNLDNHACLIDDPNANGNFTSNIGRCYYDYNADVLICDGADGSRNIWVLSKGLTDAKYITHSSAIARGRFSCVPYGTDEMLCVVTGGASGTTEVIVFKVKIDDILSLNAGDNIDTANSYDEIYSSTQSNSTARNVIHSNGFVAVVALTNGFLVLDQNLNIYDVALSNNPVDGVGVTKDGILFAKTNGSTYYLYHVTIDGADQIASISNSNFDHIMSRRLALWGNLNSGETYVEVLGICDDGGTMPVTVPDYNEYVVKIYDYRSWTQIHYDVVVVPHRLAVPIAWQGVSLPLSTNAKLVEDVDTIYPGDYLSEPGPLNFEIAFRYSEVIEK